jgi:hypothetical protein
MGMKEGKNNREAECRVPDCTFISKRAVGYLAAFEPKPDRAWWSYVLHVNPNSPDPQSLGTALKSAATVCRRAENWIKEHASMHGQPWRYRIVIMG